MAFGPADRDGTNQNKDRTWKGPSVKLWVTAPAATFPLSPVNPTGITIINVNDLCELIRPNESLNSYVKMYRERMMSCVSWARVTLKERECRTGA